MSPLRRKRRDHEERPGPPQSDPIAELLARVARGDTRAFDALYARSSAKLFGVTLRILKDRSESEEALQEVYVKIWRNAGRYSLDAGAGMSWLITVARNHSIDKLRARRPTEASSTPEAVDAAAIVLGDGPRTPEELAIQQSERDRLERSLGELEPKHAQLIRGAYLEGKSYQDLADEVEAPVNTVRTWLRRGLQKMRKSLER